MRLQNSLLNGTLLVLLPACITGCGPRKQPVPSPFRPLTDEAADTNSPSLSPDGKLIAYVSDRAGAGNADIWVRTTDGGTPVRLTDHPARDYDPVFSGDAKFVYFTSLREPLGIYRVPVAGGAAELVVRGGTSPQVSPDGLTLLFSSAPNIAVMRTAGGASRSVLSNFENSFSARWSPDGRNIMFAGKAVKEDPVEWWIVNPDDGRTLNTGLLAALHGLGFSEAYLQAWLPGDRIVFAGKQGDRVTLWQFALSADRAHMAGAPVRATDDDSGDFHAAYSAGRLVFDRTSAGLNLWSLPVDANQGKVTGDLKRLTFTTAQKGNASLSADGNKLLYSSEKDGAYGLVVEDLPSRAQKEIGPSSTFYSVLSPDGVRYAYGSGATDTVSVSTRGVSGWRSWWSRALCQRCGMPRGFSADERWLLTWSDSGPDSHVDLVDLRSGKSRTILREAGTELYGPELSRDGNWVSFVAKTGPHAFGAFIVRITGDRPAMQHDWIHVNTTSRSFQMPFWSPDGNLLYLLDTRGEGNLNWLLAQRLDAVTKRPAGEPFEVHHFEAPFVPSMDPIWNHPAAATGRIVLELADVATNIWVADTVPVPPVKR